MGLKLIARRLHEIDRMKNRNIAAVAVALALAACSKEAAKTPAPSAITPVTATTSTLQNRLAVKAQKFTVTPANVQKGQPVTVRVELENAPASMPATLAWFGPDGWLVADDTREVSGNSITFTTPADVLRDPGHYRAELRSDAVYIGETAVDVR